MELIIAFRSLAKYRSQSEWAITPREHRGEAFFMSSQQEPVTRASVAQPLLFAGMAGKNQPHMPAERREERFVFRQRCQPDGVDQITRLFVCVVGALLAGSA